jgi:CDP-4-dehydro-6-deoxyglucose reductase
MLQPWRSCRVLRIEDETPNTRRFWFEVPELEHVDFSPGQFVTLDLPIHEKPNKRWRSYSIASWPDGTNVFELIIVRLPDGAGTQYLFEQVQINTVISYRGPQGVFTLHEPMKENTFFICTGTGIAPFRSMLHHIRHKDISHKNIYLIFGCRKQTDLLYFNELKELEKSIPHFHYLPILSREEWEGETGYVHSIYQRLLNELAREQEFTFRENCRFYLCGWKNMIDEAKSNLLNAGISKKEIIQEIYG